MKVLLVTGDRKLTDQVLIESTIASHEPDLVYVGCCPTGVDYYTRLYCRASKIPLVVEYADWDKYGLAAGPVRNGVLVAKAVREAFAGATVVVVAFPRGGPGTRDCMKQAKAAALRVEQY